MSGWGWRTQLAGSLATSLPVDYISEITAKLRRNYQSFRGRRGVSLAEHR